MSAYKQRVLQALQHCSQERLDAAMENPSMMKELLELFGHELQFPFDSPSDLQNVAGGRAKRPLNAFMAFRTYYLKLFPDTQQKTASGFLTQLWAKDPHRNKWALIAKVYSFIRDHVGKARINLSAFLSVACPMMRIIEPVDYLRSLGWQISHSSIGLVLSQDVSTVPDNLGTLQDLPHPTTEIDLLTDVLTAGYFSEYSQHLQVRMWTSQNGIMTPTGAFAGDAMESEQLYEAVPTTSEKVEFINSVRENASQAAQELFGPQYDSAFFFFQDRFVHSWEVQDLTTFQNVEISIADQPMASNTLYDFNQLPENIPQVSEFVLDTSDDAGIIDLSSAWSVDKMMTDRLHRDQVREDAYKAANEVGVGSGMRQAI